MMDAIIGDMSASGISLVVGATTGVTPFLTLFLIGFMERMDPDLLHMEHIWDGKLERMLAGDAGLFVLGTATVLEFVSMCIPVVDELVDSAMIFVVPVLSVIASQSTLGLFEDIDQEDLNDLGDLLNMDDMPLNEIFDGIVNGTTVDTPDTIGDGVSESNVTVQDLVGQLLEGDTDEEGGGGLVETLFGGFNNNNNGDNGNGRRRHMQQEEDDDDDDKPRRRRRGISRFYQFFLTAVAVLMALSLHVFKMVIRLFGEGWATGCITIVEVVWTAMTIFIVVHIKPLSIVFTIVLLLVGGFGMWRLYKRIQNRRENRNNNNNATPGVIVVGTQDDGSSRKPKLFSSRSKYDKGATTSSFASHLPPNDQTSSTTTEGEEDDAMMQIALEESKLSSNSRLPTRQTLQPADDEDAMLQIALEESKLHQ